MGEIGNLQLLFWAGQFFLANFSFSFSIVPRVATLQVLLGIRRQRKN